MTAADTCTPTALLVASEQQQQSEALMRTVMFMQGAFEALSCEDSDRSALLSALLKLHASAATQLDAAPRKFMAAADVYVTLIDKKRAQLLQQQQFLKVGKADAHCGT